MDPSSCSKYNVAARWTLRQTGVVRARCEEFSPADLAGAPEIKEADPVTGEELVIQEADPWKGINILMKALEESIGRTMLDRKGELRKQFYQDMRRTAGERISAYCSRFRTLNSEMRREGIVLPSDELGWFLRSRMGLDAIRLQLLDTALRGRESYEDVESEALRLFRDLHSEDPLHKRSSERPPLLQRFLSQQSSSSSYRPSLPSSGASQRSFRTNATSTTTKSSIKPFYKPGAPRSALVAEGGNAVDEAEADEEELIPDQSGGPTDTPTLEEVLQAEVEILATELDSLEEEGVDQELLDGLESGVEQAAESLVTMREARSKIAEIKKDRGFGKASTFSSNSKEKMSGNQVNAKKSRTFCWDCGQTGHWGGDNGCPNPGAGLFRPKGAAKKPAVKHVRVTEALNTEHEEEEFDGHEVMATSRIFQPSSLVDALATSNEVYADSVQSLAGDKRLVGALDSACNRTCTGMIWLEHYLHSLRTAPEAIRGLVQQQPEEEVFRFGNGGVQRSFHRVRIPMMVGNDLVLTWVSVVPVPSLGLLLGRDWLDGVGCVLSFSKKVMRADHLSGRLIHLQQLLAGHFALQLVPFEWPSPGRHRWKKFGQDGVLELQLSPQEWLSRKLDAESSVPRCHEHLLTEQSLKAADVSFSGLKPSRTDHPDLLAQKMRSAIVNKCTSTSSTSSPSRGSPGSFRDRVHDQSGQKCRPMAKNGSPHARKGYVASPRACLVALAAALAALCSFPISGSLQSAHVAASRRADGHEWQLAPEASSESRGWSSLHYDQSQGVHLPPRSFGFEGVLRGRSIAPRNAGSPQCKRIGKSSARRSPQRGKIGGREIAGQRKAGGSRPRVDRPKRWTTHLKERFDETGSARAGESSREGDRRGAEEFGSSYCSGNSTDCTSGQEGHHQWRRQFSSRTTPSINRQKSREFSTSPTSTSRGRIHELFQHFTGRRTSAAERTRRQVPVNAVAGHAAGDANECTSNDTYLARHDHRQSSSRCDEPRSDQSLGRRGQLDRRRNEVERDGNRFLETGRKGCTERSVLPLKEITADENNNPWALHQELKPGQAQLIGQAWEKHCRDRQLISKSRNEILTVMREEWDETMQKCLNENFIMKVEIDPRRPLVGEIYTATEQVMRQAQRRGHRVSSSMSLENGWDFLQASHRKACIRKVMEEDPYCLILAFPCGPWSALNRLRHSATLEKRQEDARVLLQFALLLAKIQQRRGGHFILENPKTSLAWKLPEMIEFLEETNCEVIDFDQCRFGLKSLNGNLHKKATRVATSSLGVAEEIRDCVCQGGHLHDHVIGGAKVTSRAGHYPIALARAFVKGMERQFHVDHAQSREVLAVDGQEVEAEDLDIAVDPAQSESDISSVEGEADEKEVRIPAAVRTAVKRLHENTGHRSKRRLCRALVLSGAPKEVILAAKHLRCSLCDEKQRPKSRRPTALPTPKDVSDQVHIDVFEAEDAQGQKVYVVHAIDWTSRFQMAEALQHKSSAAISKWFQERWLPIFGPPRVLVADQGREFISWEFQELCDRHSTLLHHIPVQAPWANGVCERGGGILKTLLECCVKSHSVVGFEEMQLAVQECTMAYNADINELGVSPCQAAIGRQPRMIGDTLGSVGQRLAEHGLIDSRPSLARQVALRETARLAMTRLHFSRGLRRAELARSRSSTMSQSLEPGDIVYFWRESKYNSKTSPSKKRLSLRRWHGPALLVALEGHSAGYVSFKGQLTKCAKEHLRPASSMEQISAEVWHDAIQEAVEAAIHDMKIKNDDVSRANVVAPPLEIGDSANPHGQGETDLPPVSQEEVLHALNPPVLATSGPSDLGTSTLSRRSSLTTPGPAPGTPVPELIRRASQFSRVPSERLEAALERAQDLEPLASRKRGAEIAPESLREAELEGPSTPPIAEVEHPVLTIDAAASIDAVFNGKSHPLKIIQAQVEKDRLDPESTQVQDHGSWSGRWPMPSRSSWRAHELCGVPWPMGENEVNAAKTARREIKWKEIPEKDKPEFRAAAETGWKVQIDNSAFEVLEDAEARKVRDRLQRTGQMYKVLVPRFVYTDKNDGLRTVSKPLPLKANARLVIPGYKDETAYTIRKDAPTGARVSQHILFIVASSNGWTLYSADVKSAFLKGEFFEDGERELYICNIKRVAADEPVLPFGDRGLARLRKGVFGLADSPRRWYLRLHKSLTALGWKRTAMDAAMWVLYDGDRLCGMIISHVDDLLMAGDNVAKRTLDALGRELGFGSLETASFQYCGKLIEQKPDNAIEVSMVEYHENMQPAVIPVQRKKNPDSTLNPSEHRQLRAILGSLQWLVAQVRCDMSYQLSTLQGEPPTIRTLMKANCLMREFKKNSHFKLVFKPLNLNDAGILVVTDSSLGNVTRSGGAEGTLLTKVFSQAAYIIFIAENSLMEGGSGRLAMLDCRSHRLSRVCRSTYASELLGSEEALDAGLFCRGLYAEIKGHEVLKDTNYDSEIPLALVTDAKDVFDKGNNDTPTYGSQKSLAFTIAWLRESLRRARTRLAWTATQNMIIDSGTKEMDGSHLREVLTKCQWSIKYNPAFLKQVPKKKAPAVTRGPLLPGELVGQRDPVLSHLMRLSEQPGWHLKNGIAIHVCRNARSYRNPGPRIDAHDFPYRSTYGRFDTADQSEWRTLERKAPYAVGSNPMLIGDTANVLITIFHPQACLKSTKEVELAVKDCMSLGRLEKNG